MTIFSNDYDDISGLTVLLFCPPQWTPWPSQDSLASRDPRLPFVSSRFFMIYLLKTKLLREMSQSGMWFYLFLQWMSTDFHNLHDAPGALHQHYANVLCRRPKTWPPFRSEELFLVLFALFVCPQLIFVILSIFDVLSGYVLYFLLF